MQFPTEGAQHLEEAPQNRTEHNANYSKREEIRDNTTPNIFCYDGNQ
jgi:hypothetical protein